MKTTPFYALYVKVETGVEYRIKDYYTSKNDALAEAEGYGSTDLGIPLAYVKTIHAIGPTRSTSTTPKVPRVRRTKAQMSGTGTDAVSPPRLAGPSELSAPSRVLPTPSSELPIKPPF